MATRDLSEREKQVTSLVAQGLRNRAIGEELQISERTVEAHIARILAKVGYHSRTALAVWAFQQGLMLALLGPGEIPPSY